MTDETVVSIRVAPEARFQRDVAPEARRAASETTPRANVKR